MTREGGRGARSPARLDRIEAEMARAAPEPRRTMNNTLANIGINHPQHRKGALAIGEMVRRQETAK